MGDPAVWYVVAQITEAMREEVRGIEAQVLRRVAIGAVVSVRRLVDELVRPKPMLLESLGAMSWNLFAVERHPHGWCMPSYGYPCVLFWINYM